MDWIRIGAALSLAAAAWLLWKNWKLKKEVYDFASRLERNLDAVLSGGDLDRVEETEDSLLGKVNEKLMRADHVWKQKERESRESREQIKELISDISHQTRTPIANQKICLEILQGQALPEETRYFLEKLEHQTEKLDFLFQSLVKLSRLEAGVIKVRKKEEDLAQTLQAALQAVVPQAAGKGITLGAQVEENLQVCHDRKWTEEAVYNLLDNGVKYTEPGGSVLLYARKREMFTEIHVEDTGRGIPRERQAQIFTRFYREPEVHEQEGIGIGLYLTSQIVEQQGGYVEVRSKPGKGSDFCICLPNRKEDHHSPVILSD